MSRVANRERPETLRARSSRLGEESDAAVRQAAAIVARMDHVAHRSHDDPSRPRPESGAQRDRRQLEDRIMRDELGE